MRKRCARLAARNISDDAHRMTIAIWSDAAVDTEIPTPVARAT
jgi:hypothetical protein